MGCVRGLPGRHLSMKAVADYWHAFGGGSVSRGFVRNSSTFCRVRERRRAGILLVRFAPWRRL